MLAEKLDWPLVEIDKIENGDKFDLSFDELERLSLALHVALEQKSRQLQDLVDRGV
jgi:hypothetical protein